MHAFPDVEDAVSTPTRRMFSGWVEVRRPSKGSSKILYDNTTGTTAPTRFGLPDPRSYDLGSLNQDLLYKSPLKREKEN